MGNSTRIVWQKYLAPLSRLRLKIVQSRVGTLYAIITRCEESEAQLRIHRSLAFSFCDFIRDHIYWAAVLQCNK